jgi:cytochrome c biogenesis protein CcmG, thiol:disulfide interchange protein DsbE
MDYAGPVRKGVVLGVVGASALLIALLIYGVASEATDDSIDQAVADGKRPAAASTDLPVLGGSDEGSLEDYRGKVVVLNFWASWCLPCKDEAPLLARADRELERRGAAVLGVSYKDVPEDALGFVREYDVAYPSLSDGDGKYGSSFSVRGVPETFVIDRRGRIAALQRGPVDEEWLRETVSPLLVEGA